MAEAGATRSAADQSRTWVFDPVLIGWLVLAWPLVLGSGALLHESPGRLGPRMLAESVCYLLLFGGLLSFRPVRAWVRAIPSPHRLVLAAFVGLLTVGQLANQSRRTFPFPAWMMYGRMEAPPTLEYYRCRGVDMNGREVVADLAKLFHFVNTAEINSRLRGLARVATTAPDAAKREAARTKLADLLRAVGTAYNAKHPEAPLRSLEFVRFSWDYRHEPPSAAVPQSILRIELADGAAR